MPARQAFLFLLSLGGVGYGLREFYAGTAQLGTALIMTLSLAAAAHYFPRKEKP